MKKFFAWVKAHLLVVVFTAIIVVSIPTGFFVSKMMGKSIIDKRAQEASDKLKKVKAATVSYQLPPITPNSGGVSETRAANDKATEFFKVLRDKLKDLTAGVTTAAVEFNEGKGELAKAVARTPHAPLVPDLFRFEEPKPGPDGQPAAAPVSDEGRTGLLITEFVDKLVDRPDKPSAYTRLLREKLNAGGPLDPTVMGQRLAAQNATELQKVRGNDPGHVLTQEEKDVISRGLLDYRRNEYVRQASQYSVYATNECLPIEGNPGFIGSMIPRTIPATTPKLWQAFRWQVDYWTIEDLLHAIRVANTSKSQRDALTPITDSVVKRVERIILRDTYAVPRLENSGGEGAAPPPPVIPDVTGYVPTSPQASITGRQGGPQNPLFDVRVSHLTLVVSSKRLPELFDAFARTNFMTVIDFDLSDVDVVADLERGYYYGDESVVRAEIDVESIWLRSWIKPYMPWSVRQAMGIAIPEGIKVDPAELSAMAGSGGDAGYQQQSSPSGYENSTPSGPAPRGPKDSRGR